MTTAITSAFSQDILRQHGLTPDEYEKIKQLLGQREPTLTELGIFSVMWSEHCSYKSSRVHLKRLPRAASGCCKVRESTRALSISETAGRAPSRSNPTITRRSSSPSRGQRPEWAEFYVTYSPWERGRLR